MTVAASSETAALLSVLTVAPSLRETVLTANLTGRSRMSLSGGNALKIGLFGSNCSSGRAVTKLPERWSGTWLDNLRLARMADQAGIEFMLPIGRWKGYGGE